MKYRVRIPVGEPLIFPRLCPFTGAPSPTGTVRLKQTKNLMILPLPGGIYNRYSVTTLHVPASKKIANLALGLEIMIWVSLLGGILLGGYLLLGLSRPHDEVAFWCLIGGGLLAFAFRVWRFLVVRPVYIKPARDGYTELQFRSEGYAREFAEMNRLDLSAI
jgi:hypothetical protein